MPRFLFSRAAIAGAFLAAGAAPAFAQIYSPYPTRPPPGYGYVQQQPRGYYADPEDDNWRDEDIDPAPRQRPRATTRKPAPAARGRDDVDDYMRDQPMDLAPPANRGRAAPAPRAGRYASLPNDADPAYSTPVDLDSEIDDTQSTRRLVDDITGEAAGVITINTRTRKLYLAIGDGRAWEYGVGVGRQGFAWKGAAQIGRKAFWPGWTPPPEMLLRRPELPRHMDGGLENPLGARALYLFKGNKDTLFRIHGTNEPDTIGHAVSSGCIRMMNADVIDLYQRVRKGAKVVVL